ncbi:MAG TPA: hypothetical protein PKK06_17895 [Phycisphaerae bacterium]|nr:hypothetical protein [Phycisphaerae bacterium]HNU47091.1 hypothetical protein [Phycisphaerae bacterium]
MSAQRDADKQFDENLKVLGRRIELPAGPDVEVHARCVAVLARTWSNRSWRIVQMMRKPIVLSTLGVAALVAIVMLLLFPWHMGPAAQAAMVVQKLNEQMLEQPLLEITFERFQVEEVSIDGRLHVGVEGVAGDLDLGIQAPPPEGLIQVGVSLGIAKNDGWVLIRKLALEGGEAQMVAALLFPPGTQTLLKLPAGGVTGEVGCELGEVTSSLRSVEIGTLLRALIESREELGATVEEQRDGMVLVTLPLKDAEAVRALAQVLKDATAQPVVEATGTEEEAAREGSDGQGMPNGAGPVVVAPSPEEGDVRDDKELIGSTLKVLYDPATERVRSFSIANLAGGSGQITVRIGDGPLDPALLDSNRVMSPTTRVLDVGSLEAMIKQLEQTGGEEH